MTIWPRKPDSQQEYSKRKCTPLNFLDSATSTFSGGSQLVLKLNSGLGPFPTETAQSSSRVSIWPHSANSNDAANISGSLLSSTTISLLLQRFAIWLFSLFPWSGSTALLCWFLLSSLHGEEAP